MIYEAIATLMLKHAALITWIAQGPLYKIHAAETFFACRCADRNDRRAVDKWLQSR